MIGIYQPERMIVTRAGVSRCLIYKMIVRIANMLIRTANSEGPDQTAPSGAVCSGSTLFAQPLLLIRYTRFYTI